MSRRVYGIDLDGVLVDFNAAYCKKIKELFNLDMPALSNDYPSHWNYHKDVGIGVEKDDPRAKQLWHEIMTTDFWETLDSYLGANGILRALYELRTGGDFVYFITSRPGDYAKHLTEWWLDSRGFSCPTVLIASDKGPVCKGLGITHFVDDRLENCEDVAFACPSAQVFLLDRPYNRMTSADANGRTYGAQANVPNDRYPNIVRIHSLMEPTLFPNITKLEKPEDLAVEDKAA